MKLFLRSYKLISDGRSVVKPSSVGTSRELIRHVGTLIRRLTIHEGKIIE